VFALYEYSYDVLVEASLIIMGDGRLLAGADFTQDLDWD
jgi:hypothetical protein